MKAEKIITENIDVVDNEPLYVIYGEDHDEINKISDLLNEIKDIKYGFISKKDGSVIDDREWIHNCPDLDTYYSVEKDPEVTLNNKLGICQDQSRAIKYLMGKLHPEMPCKLFAMTTGRFGHCVPTFEDEGNWYYLENAWDKEKGLHGPFSSEDEVKDYLNDLYHEHHDEDTGGAEVIVEPYVESLTEDFNEEELLRNIQSLESAGLIDKEKADEMRANVANKKSDEERLAKEKEEQDRLAAEKEQSEKSSKIDEIINQIDNVKSNSADLDLFDKMFEVLVPSSGKADTVAGEALRCAGRILYRYLNDGDIFYQGYGKETAGTSASCLQDIADDYNIDWINMEKIAEDCYDSEGDYEAAIRELSDKLAEDLYNNRRELLVEPNTKYDRADYDEDAWDDYEPKYDYECSVPEIIQKHIEKGNITTRDVEDEMQYWDGLRDAEINFDYEDVIYISNLSKEDFDEIDGSVENWLEQYGEDLNVDYGDPYFDPDDTDVSDLADEIANRYSHANNQDIYDVADIFLSYAKDSEGLDSFNGNTTEEIARDIVSTYYQEFKRDPKGFMDEEIDENQRNKILWVLGLLPDTNLGENLTESVSSCRLIWDDCTPAGDRRPTTEDDIDQDIHVKEFDNAEDLFDVLLQMSDFYDQDEFLSEYEDILGNNPSIEDQVETILGCFDDLGDGSANILYCKVNGNVISEGGYDCLDKLDLDNCSEDEVKEACKEAFVEEEDDEWTFACLDWDGEIIEEFEDKTDAIIFAENNEEIREVVLYIDGEPDECIWARDEGEHGGQNLGESGYGWIKIDTGLTSSKDADILRSVLGQLSDGMWENSPRMSRYWKNMEILEENGKVLIHCAPIGPYFDWDSEEDVKKFFATKMKAVAKAALEWDTGGKEKWDRNTDYTFSGYFHRYNFADRNDPITLRDVYRVYDKLLGRKDRIPANDNVNLGEGK